MATFRKWVAAKKNPKKFRVCVMSVVEIWSEIFRDGVNEEEVI